MHENDTGTVCRFSFSSMIYNGIMVDNLQLGDSVVGPLVIGHHRNVKLLSTSIS